jgi:hypothetical protein
LGDLQIPGTAKGLPEAVPMGATINAVGLTGAINGLSGFNAFQRPGAPPLEPVIAALRLRRERRITTTSPSTRSAHRSTRRRTRQAALLKAMDERSSDRAKSWVFRDSDIRL